MLYKSQNLTPPPRARSDPTGKQKKKKKAKQLENIDNETDAAVMAATPEPTGLTATPPAESRSDDGYVAIDAPVQQGVEGETAVETLGASVETAHEVAAVAKAEDPAAVETGESVSSRVQACE